MRPGERQQVLFLWLDDSALDARVLGWSFHDGGGDGSVLDGEPPYPTGEAALRDGWRLIQVSPLIPPALGAEHTTSFLRHEFLFERIVEFSAGPDA